MPAPQRKPLHSSIAGCPTTNDAIAGSASGSAALYPARSPPRSRASDLLAPAHRATPTDLDVTHGSLASPAVACVAVFPLPNLHLDRSARAAMALHPQIRCAFSAVFQRDGLASCAQHEEVKVPTADRVGQAVLVRSCACQPADLSMEIWRTLQTLFSVGTIVPMKCPVCKKDFVAIRADAQYCSVNCRSRAYRLRLRTAARREEAGEADSDEDANRSSKRAQLLTAATGCGKRPRVAIEQQVLSQVPPLAYRYRLVLGVVPGRSEPVMAPEEGAWNLMPFEAPSDPRLLSGQTYRIIWIDQHGEEVPPLAWAATPSLYFFLGEPDAEISAQQVESRYQTQLVMQLRRQVQELEEKLVRAERKHRRTKKTLRAFQRRARDKIRELKLLHKKDSVQTFINDWGPVAAVGAGLYLLMRHRRKKKAEAAAPNQELRPSEAPSDVQEKPRTVEEGIPKTTQRVHSLLDSFSLLTQLVESRVSPPTQLELAQLSSSQLWTHIGKWLEGSSVAKTEDPPRASIRSYWKALRRVAAATSTLAFMSQSLLTGDSEETHSACTRELLHASERFDERFRAWLAQRDVAAAPQPKDQQALRAFGIELTTLLREQLPAAGDRFGQVFHDALNATRIRLYKALGEQPEPIEAGEPLSESSMTDFLEEVAAVHGPLVLQRAVRDLVLKWTGANIGLGTVPFGTTAGHDDEEHAGASAN